MNKVFTFLLLSATITSCGKKEVINCGDPPPPYTPALRYVDKNTGKDILQQNNKVVVWQPCAGREQNSNLILRDSSLYIEVNTGLHTTAYNTSPCNILYVTLNNNDADTLEFIGEYKPISEGSKNCPPNSDFVVSKLLCNGVEAEIGWFNEEHRHYNQYFILKK